MFGLSPYLLLGWVLSIVTTFGLTAWQATRIANEHCQVTIGKLVVESQQRKDEEARQATDAARKLEADNAQARQRLREARTAIDRLARRPVYQRDCLDADGLRAVRDALAGQGAAAAGPGAAQPGPPRPP